MRLPPRWVGVMVVLAAGAAAVVVSAAGPASARSAKSATKTIEVTWSHPAGDPKYVVLAEIAKKFETANPGVKVNILFDGGDKSPPITARWRAGNPPEVTDEGSFFDGTEPSTWQWVQARKVYDLTSIMNQRLPGSKLTWKNSILPFALAPLTYPKNKHIYATPGEVTAVSFYYNKQIFAQNGITPPKTWPQFLAICAKLKAAGIAPLAVTGTYAPRRWLCTRSGGDQRNASLRNYPTRPASCRRLEPASQGRLLHRRVPGNRLHRRTAVVLPGEERDDLDGLVASRRNGRQDP